MEVNVLHMDSKDNYADILTTFCSSNEWYELLGSLIFWRASGDESGSLLSTDESVKTPFIRTSY